MNDLTTAFSVAKKNPSDPEVTIDVVDKHQPNDTDEDLIWTKKRIFRSWLLLCFSTGPVASMSRTYVPAAIQSIAQAVGHTSNGGKCKPRGNDCFVRFGGGDVHAISYVMYLNAISTAIEGVLALFLMGIADYSNYRKWFLICSICLYGALAVPFVGLTDKTYAMMTAAAALFSLLKIDSVVYEILEGSYIPLFMRSAVSKGLVAEDVRREMILKRGSKVSVLGLVLGNCGGIAALLIGLIISHTRGGPIQNGYHDFLLAITIAGCCTMIFSMIAAYFIPRVQGKPRPQNKYLLFLTVERFWYLLLEIRKYPHAFLFCVSWVIWNVTYSNFLQLFVLLFRQTLGIGVSDAEYTVYTFMMVIVASMGSLLWLFLYPRCKLTIKTWGYGFYAVSVLSNFWGCLGVNHNSKVGFKHRWEFWVFEVFYTSTSSAMRSMNRCVYSTLLPAGDEAQYFGLEIFLGLATGWIGSLVNATVQDRTGNARMPFIPNCILAVIALVLYYFVDTEKGMEDAEKLVGAESDISSVDR